MRADLIECIPSLTAHRTKCGVDRPETERGELRPWQCIHLIHARERMIQMVQLETFPHTWSSSVCQLLQVLSHSLQLLDIAAGNGPVKVGRHTRGDPFRRQFARVARGPQQHEIVLAQSLPLWILLRHRAGCLMVRVCVQGRSGRTVFTKQYMLNSWGKGNS